MEFQKKCEDLQDKVSGLQKEIQRMVRILLDLIWEDQLHYGRVIRIGKNFWKKIGITFEPKGLQESLTNLWNAQT